MSCSSKLGALWRQFLSCNGVRLWLIRVNHAPQERKPTTVLVCSLTLVVVFEWILVTHNYLFQLAPTKDARRVPIKLPWNSSKASERYLEKKLSGSSGQPTASTLTDLRPMPKWNQKPSWNPNLGRSAHYPGQLTHWWANLQEWHQRRAVSVSRGDFKYPLELFECPLGKNKQSWIQLNHAYFLRETKALEPERPKTSWRTSPPTQRTQNQNGHTGNNEEQRAQYPRTRTQHANSLTDVWKRCGCLLTSIPPKEMSQFGYSNHFQLEMTFVKRKWIPPTRQIDVMSLGQKVLRPSLDIVVYNVWLLRPPQPRQLRAVLPEEEDDLSCFCFPRPKGYMEGFQGKPP